MTLLPRDSIHRISVTRAVFFALGFSMLAIAPAVAFAGAGDDSQGWVLKQHEKDVESAYKLFVRPRSGSKYNEYRMEVPVEERPGKVMAALEHNMLDPETHPAHFRRTVLRREAGVIVSHDYIRVPFLSDRDVVLRTEVGRDPKTGFRTMQWRSVDGEGPTPGDGVVRMPSSTGSWTLQPDGHGGTLAVYESHVELGGSLPSSFVESQMPREIIQQANQLRRTMRERTLAKR